MNPPRKTQEPAPVVREDFREPVKRAIAARAGHRCSNPTCGAPTSGPQVVADKSLNVGVAAHINAATAIVWDLAFQGKPVSDQTANYLTGLRARLNDLFPQGHPLVTRHAAETRSNV